MLRFLVLPFLWLQVGGMAASAQAPSDPHFRRQPSFATAQAFVDSLGRIAAVPDAAARTAVLDRLWDDLRTKGQVPFAVGDTVVWLFRGAASSVAWAGDMTGWQPRAAGQRLEGTDLWWRREHRKPDARLDYKVVVNGNDWRLDPANPLQQWSGFGPNSELRMPEYRYPAETIRRPEVPAGRLGDPQTMQSASLGYAVRYRVYTPAGYDTLGGRLPVLYVTDGHEYAPDALGALVTVLDNLVAARQVAPLLAVFVDPRDVGNAAINRRQSELVPPGGRSNVCNPCRGDRFLAFLTGELVPALDAAYRTQAGPSGRGILGTSLGGLFAAYAGKTRPDVFGRVASMSPAFWAWEGVYALYTSSQPGGQRLFLSQGTVSDGDGGDRLSAVLNTNGYTYTYVRRNEGHSWGHWRAIEGVMLRTLFPGASLSVTTGAASQPGLHLEVAPNPARGGATIRWHLDAPGAARLSLFDTLGREVQRFSAEGGASGPHHARIATGTLGAGTYLARLSTSGGAVVVPFVVLP